MLPHRRANLHAGFTLVEMLIAVAIMLLMMSMFAEIFQLAGSTITTQRGIAENDQRSRSIQTIITSDLDKRSFRYVMPWAVGEDSTLGETNAALRKGYIYISENSPLNDLDDILQFTIDVNDIRQNPDISKLYGKATLVAPIIQNPNQPEADDGWAVPNNTSTSSAAEVSYFVRNGKLFRRVLLLRQPLLLDGATSQPTFKDPNGNDRDMFDPNATIPAGGLSPYPVTGTTGTTTFWNEFDSSAFYFSPGAGSPTPWAHFHGVEDLTNTSGTLFPLGKPFYRFGHRTDTARSREFDSSSNYFGRYTQEETSHPDFRYPHGLSNVAGGANPMMSTAAAFTVNANDAVFDSFRNGPRRGEDLLVSNVHSFDVKVWDQLAAGGTGAFVDIGGSAAVDYFAPGTASTPPSPGFVPVLIPANTVYGPVAGASVNNRVFDTWYPFAGGSPSTNLEIDLDGNSINDPPPLRTLSFYPPSYSRGAPYVTVPVWSASNPQAVGDLVFPKANQRANGYRFCYRCVGTIGGGPYTTDAANEPIWPAAVGGRVQDGTVFWEAIENWKPLRAIQITIRFLDTTSQLMRQITIVHSLVD